MLAVGRKGWLWALRAPVDVLGVSPSGPGHCPLRSRSREGASPPFGAVSLTRTLAPDGAARGTTGRRPTVPLLHAAYSTAGPPRIAWPWATRPAQPGRARRHAHPSLPGLADGQGSSGAASAAKRRTTP